MDAQNLQGANLRQVIASGDQAALHQAQRKDGGEFQSRLGHALVEKALRARDQSDAADMVVKRHEDQAQFSTGDSLNGGGGGPGTGSSEPRTSSDGDSIFEESNSRSSLETLEAPFDVADRFRSALSQGGREVGDRTFRAIDRMLLAGLLDQSA